MSTDLIQRLRSLSHGFEEWRVESPVDGSYCMSYTRDDDLSPEQAARGWLAEHLLRHPDSQFAGYVVKKHVVKTRKDQALDDAADALERLEAENARITECGRAHIRRAAALEEDRDRFSKESAQHFVRAREWAERAGAMEAERDQLRAELEALRADSFESVIQGLAATIPDDGSSITIHVEHWAGSVTATDWDGNEMPEHDSDTVLDRVRCASRWLDEQQSTLKQGSTATS